MNEEFERKEFSVTVDCDQETGRVVSELWRDQFGRFDRPRDLPAVTFFCPDTGNISQQRWHQSVAGDGPHRDGDKPAKIIFDPETGIKLIESYIKSGRYHRDEGKPAEIVRRLDGSEEERLYFRHGKLDRPISAGPAVVRFDETGNVTSSEYWIEGRKIDSKSPQPRLDR
ncbi:MAG: hypothetical protein AAGK79_16045 [Pseudomonadota bacterium]